MPLFTRCNIGLGCPQIVSVNFQAKIPHRSFIITAGKYHFWGVSKNELVWSVCKWAAYSRPVSRRGRCVSVSLHCISTAINTWQKQHYWERENRYIWESNAPKVGRNSAMLQSSRRNGPNRGTAVPNESHALLSYKVISQVRRWQRPQQLGCWEKMKTLIFSLTSKHRARDCLRDIVDVTAARVRRK